MDTLLIGCPRKQHLGQKHLHVEEKVESEPHGTVLVKKLNMYMALEKTYQTPNHTKYTCKHKKEFKCESSLHVQKLKDGTWQVYGCLRLFEYTFELERLFTITIKYYDLFSVSQKSKVHNDRHFN